MRPPRPLTDTDLTDHLQRLDRDGFTIVPQQLDDDALAALRDIAQRAADDYITAWENGMPLRRVAINDNKGTRDLRLNPNARCAYLWGDAALDLLDHDTIHAIASQAMGAYYFQDMVANTVRTTPDRKWGFHRDYTPGLTAEGKHNLLWFFFLMDGYTSDNGGTWVVPGSHAFGPGVEAVPPHAHADEEDPYPSKVQAIGAPGDLVIVNAGGIHSGGANRTPDPRRTLNVRLVQADGPMLVNQWELAGPERQAKLSARAARMLQPPAHRVADLGTDWAVQPEGVQL